MNPSAVKWVLILASAALVAGACRDEPKAGKRLDPVPSELRPRVELAETAMGELQKTLGGRLKQALAEGPSKAVEVCAAEAQRLTAEVGRKHGVQLGRSSHRLRNPKNEARPWVAAYLADNARTKAARVDQVVFDLGDRIGVVRPIAMQQMCTTCHGPTESIDEGVRKQLAREYPHDRATGFMPGDLRGVFWAEVEK